MASNPITTNPRNKDDSARMELHQAMIDDTQDEQMAVSSIFYRTNYLHSLINQRNRENDKNSSLSQSLTLSISRESKHIISLIEEFHAMKTKHFENQHMILKRLIKKIKSYQ